MLWTSGQSSPKFGLYVLFGFAFCNPSRRVSISAFVHSLWTNEKVKYRQCLCFARQTYSKEVLEINTSRYSLKIFILTTYSTLKNISCVYIHQHIHTFIEPWQATRWSTSIHICFARQTYSEEVLEINTNRYSLKIFILTTYSTLKNISCVYVHRHIHTFIEPWQVTRWSTSIHSCSHAFWRRQWHPIPVLLPGKSHGWRSLVGCSPWGR